MISLVKLTGNQYRQLKDPRFRDQLPAIKTNSLIFKGFPELFDKYLKRSASDEIYNTGIKEGAGFSFFCLDLSGKFPQWISVFFDKEINSNIRDEKLNGYSVLRIPFSVGLTSSDFQRRFQHLSERDLSGIHRDLLLGFKPFGNESLNAVHTYDPQIDYPGSGLNEDPSSLHQMLFWANYLVQKRIFGAARKLDIGGSWFNVNLSPSHGLATITLCENSHKDGKAQNIQIVGEVTGGGLNLITSEASAPAVVIKVKDYIDLQCSIKPVSLLSASISPPNAYTAKVFNQELPTPQGDWENTSALRKNINNVYQRVLDSLSLSLVALTKNFTVKSSAPSKQEKISAPIIFIDGGDFSDIIPSLLQSLNKTTTVQTLVMEYLGIKPKDRKIEKEQKGLYQQVKETLRDTFDVSAGKPFASDILNSCLQLDATGHIISISLGNTSLDEGDRKRLEIAKELFNVHNKTNPGQKLAIQVDPLFLKESEEEFKVEQKTINLFARKISIQEQDGKPITDVNQLQPEIKQDIEKFLFNLNRRDLKRVLEIVIKGKYYVLPFLKGVSRIGLEEYNQALNSLTNHVRENKKKGKAFHPTAAQIAGRKRLESFISAGEGENYDAVIKSQEQILRLLESYNPAFGLHLESIPARAIVRNRDGQVEYFTNILDLAEDHPINVSIKIAQLILNRYHEFIKERIELTAQMDLTNHLHYVNEESINSIHGFSVSSSEYLDLSDLNTFIDFTRGIFLTCTKFDIDLASKIQMAPTLDDTHRQAVADILLNPPTTEESRVALRGRLTLEPVLFRQVIDTLVHCATTVREDLKEQLGEITVK